ncbi:MAG: hypothetical protein ACPGJS_01310 [Flammeovirgaceae bacterium]
MSLPLFMRQGSNGLTQSLWSFQGDFARTIIIVAMFCLSAIVQGQAQDLESKLQGQRWALTSYIQVEGAKYDTLFTAFDCEGEYIQFNADGTLKDTNVKKLLRFSVSADSIITLKKQSGIIHKKSRVSYFDGEKLTLIDVNRGRGLFFIENYKRCTDNTGAISKDSRNLVEIKKQTSVYVDVQQWESTFFSLGLSWLKKDWKKNALYKQVGLQINPSEDMLGVTAGLATQNIFMYGAGISAHTDFDRFQVGLQPMVGITGKPLGEFGENIQLYYSFIFPFAGDNINSASSNFITLRINFPVKKGNKKERVIHLDNP